MTILSLLGMAVAGLVGGAIFTVTVVFVGIKLNLKGIGTATAGLRRDAQFYRSWALLGGVLGGLWLTAIPILDASDIKDPWYGLIMIGIGLAVFLPMIRFIRRQREGSPHAE
jgi:hypothetical protein